MNIAIIETYNSKKLNIKRMIDAHLRNSLILAKYLKADLLCVEADFLRAIKKKYDILILGYASGYAPFKLIKKIVENNETAQKFVISNEYNKAESIGGFKPFHAIVNYEGCTSPQAKKVSFLNLNLLLSSKANEIINKKYDCIYYGTYRLNRSKYFLKYLQKKIYVSSSIKNFKKYKNVGCAPTFAKKLSWVKKKETLNLFRYSLYLEDEHTHVNFNNLANRWYEAGICNCVVFFDVNCWNTIRKSELTKFEQEIKYYIVSSYEDLQKKINECNQNFNKHLNIQKLWRKDESLLKEKMLIDFKNIIYEGKNLQKCDIKKGNKK